MTVTPTPKSLIVDLLSTLPRSRRGSMPVRALVAAGRCFGIAENSTRVALARLNAAGTVERDERGRYRLGDGTEATRREVSSWKTRHEDIRSWTERRWLGVIGSPRVGRPGRKAAARRSRALLLLGFRALAPDLHVRPDNLVGGAPHTRERLFALDPGLADSGAIVATLADLDEPTEQRALALWDSQEAVRAYAHSRGRLSDSESDLPARSAEEAMVETFLTGGQVLRQIALDPLLPDEIVPAADRAALVTAMRHYDEVGRACWAGFLESFDVPHMRAPSDLRVADAPLQTALVADARIQAETGGTA
jgi:phenylacetic acid degradation operon negative regulatory protein